MAVKLDPNKLHAIINRIAAENIYRLIMIRSMLFVKGMRLDIHRPAMMQ